MSSLGLSCCLFKPKSKYKTENIKDSLENNLYSQSETSNLECIFFPKTTFILDQKCLIGNVRCFRLKIGSRLSYNISVCVLEASFKK